MPDPIPSPSRAPHPAPVGPAADLLAEFGGVCCPSLAAMLERLIDGQAAAGAGR